MNKIKVGVVGLGRLGYIHAYNLAFRIPNASLVAVCSIREEELMRAKSELDVHCCFTDVEEMLKQVHLHALVIASPSEQHCKHISVGLRAGLHIFCEKPLGIGIESCKKAEDIVNEHPDQIFMLGFMRRYDESYRYAKEKIDDGYIGKPILLRCYSVDPVHSIKSTLDYLHHSAGQFIDMAIHDIDLARWMLKAEPKSIMAMGACYEYKEFADYGEGDNVSALMQFENDTMVFLYTGRAAAQGYVIETEIVGTRATIRIGSVPQQNLVELIDHTGITKKCMQGFSERFGHAFETEIQEFINCIIENRQPEVNVYDGLRATCIAEMATTSLKENKFIKL